MGCSLGIKADFSTRLRVNVSVKQNKLVLNFGTELKSLPHCELIVEGNIRDTQMIVKLVLNKVSFEKSQLVWWPYLQHLQAAIFSDYLNEEITAGQTHI